MTKKVFVYIWEYIVKEECLSEFALLDEHSERFTEQERLIGDFDTTLNRY